MTAPAHIPPRIAAALNDPDPDIRSAAQYALDTGDTSELDWLEQREEAREAYGAWAYAYETRTGGFAPDMDDTRWGGFA